jgi:hypothetical protein
MATLADLRNDTLILLNEVGPVTTNLIGTLPDSGGSTAVVSTTTTIDQYINEAAAELARACIFIPVTGTKSAFTGSSLDLSTLTTSTTIWFPMSVTVGTTLLQHTSDTRLRAWQPNFETFTGTFTLPNGGTTTSATYWYKRQPQTIGIFPSVASSSTVYVYGAGLPATISTGADATFAPDDVLRNTLPVYAAYKLAMKNLDDPSLAARIQLWQQWWFDSTQRLWNQLDSSLKMEGSPYQSPPVAPPAVK